MAYVEVESLWGHIIHTPSYICRQPDTTDDIRFGAKNRQREILDILAKEPTVDAVEVVRCKDCVHRPVEMGEYRLLEFPDEVCPCQEMDADYADWYGQMLTDDWFCANGEKKNES